MQLWLLLDSIRNPDIQANADIEDMMHGDSLTSFCNMKHSCHRRNVRGPVAKCSRGLWLIFANDCLVCSQ